MTPLPPQLKSHWTSVGIPSSVSLPKDSFGGKLLGQNLSETFPLLTLRVGKNCPLLTLRVGKNCPLLTMRGGIGDIFG
jgi:hypothetical protein